MKKGYVGMRRTFNVFLCFLSVCLCSLCWRGCIIPKSAAACGSFGSDIAWVYRCNRLAEKKVSLTFDDGPHPKLTPIILDILKEYGVQATFFVVGENAERYPELISRILREGHEIGNHTFSHVQATKIDRETIEEEIKHCESVIDRISGVKPRFFRPPCGAIDSQLGGLCDSLNYRVVLWSIDTRDWCRIPSADIAQNVLKTVKNGDIILMHDYIGSNSPTPNALKKIIPALIARGYEFAPVGDLLSIGYEIEPTVRT